MKDSHSSPNLKAIAESVGVSKATVSRVLRGLPGHKAATRDKILKVAKELGYEPHPVMSAVMSTVRFKKTAHFSPVIAEVHCQPWGRKRGYNMQVLRDSIHEQAERLGYRVEEFNWFEPNMTPSRLLQILRARGIRGVILEHFMEKEVQLDLDLSDFSIVTVGGALKHPRLHRIEPNHYSNLLRVIPLLRQRGYSRFGVVVPKLFEDISDFKREAALRIAQPGGDDGIGIPVFFLDERNSFDGFEQWLATYRPDCILGTGRELPRELARLGLNNPEEMGFVHLGWHASYEGMAGIDPHWDQAGRTAVNLVVDQLNRNEFGVPNYPLSILTEGEWIEGSSVRAPDCEKAELVYQI